MTTMDSILAEQQFLQGLRPEIYKMVLGCASNVKFEPGEFVLREGMQADWFYLIRDGKVAVEVNTAQQGPITVQTVEKGDVLGWSWLIPPYQWRFDARAIERTRAIALDGKCLRQKCEENYELGYVLLKRFSTVIVQRLEATRLQLLDLYGVSEENKRG
ncbi:MAG: cyclic nucleotide-binding domain-containing protein [Chlamydiota bacterium]|nr:cyclic nucleotide-binding domain-containing protein [Chlamydiota bacterium]